MSNLGNYTFTMTSELGLININDTLTARAYGRIFFYDSIFNFYPQLEVDIKDMQGVVSEQLFNAEGLAINVKFGREKLENSDSDKQDTTYGYYVNDYAWIKSDINQTEIKNQISGHYIFSLVHESFIEDAPSTKAYYDSIDNIVKTVLTDQNGMNFIEDALSTVNDKGINSSKSNIFIEKTQPDLLVWYQASRWGRTFIDFLSKKAVAFTHDNSPYHTFINNRGEFYFASISYLLSQSSIAEYRVEETLNSLTDPYTVKGYTLHTGGSEVNKKNYKREFYIIKTDGSSVYEDIDLSTRKQVIDGNTSKIKDKFTIVKEKELGIGSYLTQIDNFGLYDSEDTIVYKGWKNYFYIDTVLSYRMEISIFFNPNLCAGKVITLKVGQLSEKTFATEYTGPWLIIESRVHMDIEGVPIQILLIAKSGISIDSAHSLVDNFI